MKWMVLAVLALAACESKGGAGATTGGLGTPDGGVKPLPGETCGPEAACSNGLSYQQCMAPGDPCVARFITSDNQTFNCAGCGTGECMAAAASVAMWCGGGDDKCKEETTHDACLDCCIMAHQSGSQLFVSEYQKCLCDSPGDCFAECDSYFCASGVLGEDFLCDFCVSGSSCGVSSKCMANADCQGYIDCADTCPAP